jgi:APA family basic amino acid/polyamine antiporter
MEELDALFRAPGRDPVGQVEGTKDTETRGASRGFGLTTATALIVGSIIGVGVFNLPTSFSGYGPITLVSLGLTTIGAFALAVLFAAPSRRLPAGGEAILVATLGS